VKEGRILHLVICLLREELLEDGDEVSFVRMLEGGHLLSFMEAWTSLESRCCHLILNSSV
jgi:hypothetical protein